MSNSRFEYVKTFEKNDKLLPECYLIVRVDGRGFKLFCEKYEFQKPNDIKALSLMNEAAKSVSKEFSDIIMAYGDSDEYSFLLKQETQIFERKKMKIVSNIVSLFTSFYMYHWRSFFPDLSLCAEMLPKFDGRIVEYPNFKCVRDYFSWRQVDCHINNLYNTTFWLLVNKKKMTRSEAENFLIGTNSSDKNEILFLDFNINYNNEPEIFRKGSVIIKTQNELNKKHIEIQHIDIIKNDKFWDQKIFLKKKSNPN